MADDSISDEDRALFQNHMRSVKPLKEKNKRVNAPVIKPSKPLTIKKAPINPEKSSFFLSDFIQETVLSNTLLSYNNKQLASKQFRALKNGQIPWEARLDLHGLKTDDARQALIHFIEKQTSDNKRSLLIIHGKGGHEGAPPVIKNLVNRWLPQFEQVLAFHSALPKDGGQGALYVLLKRNRTAE